jgi:hypothetical protein
MTSSLLGAAIAMVRGWTRLYTWRLPPALRDSRRAEIESDIWESGRDSDGRPSPAHVVARLLLGVTDDLRWRMAHASIVSAFVMIIVAITTTMFLVAAFWMIDLLKARRLPVPPHPPLLTPAPPAIPPAVQIGLPTERPQERRWETSPGRAV